MISICAGIVSYCVNLSSIYDDVRAQLLLSTEQTIQRESLPFREIRELEINFIKEFTDIDADLQRKTALTNDFDMIFYRHADGSYTQRPGLFEGKALPDGRRFTMMSATYAPDHEPTDDIKARFVLSYMLSFKYGSVNQGRLFNFYGVIPEKGFPIFQASDIAKIFTYGGPDALDLDTYEFFSRGFDPTARDTFMTKMYFDYSNNVWMTTVATPDAADGAGHHRILACVDVPLDDLLQRLAYPAIQGAYSTLFLADEDGSLMFDPDHLDAIKQSGGSASIKSLDLDAAFPLLSASRTLPPGKVILVDTTDAIIAVGHIPDTQVVLAISYPRSLMQPSIVQNLVIVIIVGLLSLLIEAFVIRSILRNQVEKPLGRLLDATRILGMSSSRIGPYDLPIQSQDEIGELARDFAKMADRVQSAQAELESKVQERTLELEKANQKLAALTKTDGLTGIANRRRFDEVLEDEWRRGKRSSRYLMLAMIDVDWFKKYNDHYGHQAGDDCLKAVAHTLEAHASRAGDLIARYGGEEFSLIVTMTSPDKVLAFAQSICDAIGMMQIPHEASLFGRVTVSIGVAGVIPDEYESPKSLLQRADKALYRAKELGRNQVVVWPNGGED